MDTLGAILTRSFWNGAMSNHVANLCKKYKSYTKVTSTDNIIAKGLIILQSQTIPASYVSPANGRVGSGGT